jgi:GDP-D-mannose 3', 5'-epimerase
MGQAIKTAIICGGNGFIGHHLARRLKSEGYWVRVVDIEPYKYGANDYADEVLIYDLRDPHWADVTMRLDEDLEFTHYPKPYVKEIHFDEVYNLCCLMGGMGFIGDPRYTYDVMVGSTEMTLNVLQSAIKHKANKIFYSSSACVYNENLQKKTTDVSLSEKDSYPAAPDLVYGWQKLFSEQLHQASQDRIDIRIARFHNIYGPEGTYKGGKEKAPAAMCRKAIEANRMVEVWGTGNQTRSFLYIDDCIDAVRLLMQSDHKGPINIGSEEMVTINQLAEIAIELSGRKLAINNIQGPVGVMGRNSNNDLIRSVLGWTPTYTLKEGMTRTFSWINQQVNGLQK